MIQLFVYHIIYVMSALFIVQVAQAKNNTSDYYKCYNRVSGTWTFGRAPYACDLSAFGDPDLLNKAYRPLVFDDRKTRSLEQDRYTQEMYGFIKDSSIYYIRMRKPSVSRDEMTNWAEAIYAVAHQESFWSHFRSTSSNVKNLKMMRGDSGHGHGMMQIDDRWHFTKITSGKAANLITNMIYAFEIYYEAWEQAAKASCVRGSSDWTARSRAAYSAYNGGLRQLCRWTNPNDRWAKNDKNFYDKFRNKSWLKDVSNLNYNTSLDLKCLFGGNESCGLVSNPAPTPSPTPAPNPTPPVEEVKNDRFYKGEKGEICGWSGKEFICVPHSTDMACINAGLGTSNERVENVSNAFFTGKKKWVLDRHYICPNAVKSLFKVGQTIQLQRNINMRGTPAGALIKTLPAGTRLQVLDYFVNNEGSQKRYYKVSYNGTLGFIYSGDRNSYDAWVVKSTQNPQKVFIARVNENVEITSTSGINQRVTPGGELRRNIPKGVWLRVLNVVVKEDQNKVYYLVNYKGSIGYIYGGRTLPSPSLSDWTQVR